MFNWLKNIFRKEVVEPMEEDVVGYYHPGQRMIFRYFNGEKEVAADPMVLYKRVMDVGTELSVQMKSMRVPSKWARESHDGAISKIRTIFNLKPLEEGGLTESECLDLIEVFMLYCDDIKKNSNLSPTSAKETSATSASSSEDLSSTSNSSVSGSTPAEPSIVKPIPST